MMSTEAWLPLRSLIIGASACMVLTGCDEDLFTKPPRTATAPTFDTQVSTIGAMASIPIDQVTALANAKTPASFSADGNGDDVCAEVGYRIPTPLGDIKDKKKVCTGTKYEFSASRGTISLAAGGPNTLRVSVPVSFSGKGGFRGDLAKGISADAKNFSGAVVIDADFTPRLMPDWCPQLDASVSYRWTTNPRVEIVSGIWLDVKDRVDNKLSEKIPELISEAKNSIDCAKFKRDLEAVYGSKTFPVSIPTVGQVHVNVQPTDIAFSGLNVDAQLVKASAMVSAKVEVSGQPLQPQMMPLPALKTIGAVPPQIALRVPLRVPYPVITKALAGALVGKTFEQNSQAGKLAIKVKGVDVYPSGGRLVVDLDVVADVPGSFLDTSGHVYFFATPNIESGTRVSLNDVGFSQVLDNKFWAVAAVIFEGEIRDALKKAAVYDLSPDIATAKATLQTKLNDPATIPAWTVHATDVDMKVGRVAVAKDELAVEAVFRALATVQPRL